MAANKALYFFLLLLFCVSTYCTPLSHENVLKWPTDYHFRAEVIDLIKPMKSSIEVWYSATLKRSSIQHYGVKKVFYTPDKMPYMIHPVTNKYGDNKVVCIKNIMLPKGLKAFLPDATSFKNTGNSTTFNGKNVDIWTGGWHLRKDWWVNETLFVSRDAVRGYIPLKLDYMVYNSTTGVIYRRNITEYHHFESVVKKEVVTVPNSEECRYIYEFVRPLDGGIYLLQPNISSDLDIAFNRYKNNHRFNYRSGENLTRLDVFAKNYSMVVDHNGKDSTFKMELNQFAGQPHDELELLAGTLRSDSEDTVTEPFPYTREQIEDIAETLPEEYDLRVEGIIGPIKDQGTCNACYAFATTAAVEAAYAKKYATNNGSSTLLDLSEQSIVDCSWQYGNIGCSGGFFEQTMEYILAKGIPKEMDYIYMNSEGYCNIRNITNTYKVKRFIRVPPNDKQAMKVALYKYGPVVISIRAELEMFFYASGIYKAQTQFSSSCYLARRTHATLVVGYGVRDGEEFWIVKNSYGHLFGEDGYILLSSDEDNCFLTLREPFFPEV